jgi:hypothetical protein
LNPRKRLILAIAFVSLIAVVGGGVLVDSRAESLARAFCEVTEGGEGMQEVATRAGSAGDGRFRLIAEEQIRIAYLGMPPFSRHACMIHGANGKVTSVEYVRMD